MSMRQPKEDQRLENENNPTDFREEVTRGLRQRIDTQRILHLSLNDIEYDLQKEDKTLTSHVLEKSSNTEPIYEADLHLLDERHEQLHLRLNQLQDGKSATFYLDQGEIVQVSKSGNTFQMRGDEVAPIAKGSSEHIAVALFKLGKGQVYETVGSVLESSSRYLPHQLNREWINEPVSKFSFPDQGHPKGYDGSFSFTNARTQTDHQINLKDIPELNVQHAQSFMSTLQGKVDPEKIESTHFQIMESVNKQIDQAKADYQVAGKRLELIMDAHGLQDKRDAISDKLQARSFLSSLVKPLTSRSLHKQISELDQSINRILTELKVDKVPTLEQFKVETDRYHDLQSQHSKLHASLYYVEKMIDGQYTQEVPTPSHDQAFVITPETQNKKLILELSLEKLKDGETRNFLLGPDHSTTWDVTRLGNEYQVTEPNRQGDRIDVGRGTSKGTAHEMLAYGSGTVHETLASIIKNETQYVPIKGLKLERLREPVDQEYYVLDGESFGPHADERLIYSVAGSPLNRCIDFQHVPEISKEERNQYIDALLAGDKETVKAFEAVREKNFEREEEHGIEDNQPER